MTLVLLPGLDGTGLLFMAIAAELRDQFRILIVSYPNDEALGYAELESFAREALPTDGPFVLVAESFSGPIAISIAASNPPGLVGLVLSCSFVRNPHPELYFLEALLCAVPVKKLPMFLLGAVLLGRHSSRALVKSIKQSISLVSSQALRARLRAVLSVDHSADLSRLRVPLLYLRAKQDRLVPAGAASHLATLYPATEVVDLAGPHFLLQASPKEAARVIDAFVAQIRTTSSERICHV